MKWRCVWLRNEWFFHSFHSSVLFQSNGFAAHHLQPLVFEKFCGSRFGVNLPPSGAFMYVRGPFLACEKRLLFQVGHPEVGTDLCWPMCVCRCSACLWLSQFSMKQWVKSFNNSEDSVLHQRGENSQNCGYFSLNIFPNEVLFASVLATKNTKDMR